MNVFKSIIQLRLVHGTRVKLPYEYATASRDDVGSEPHGRSAAGFELILARAAHVALWLLSLSVPQAMQTKPTDNTI